MAIALCTSRRISETLLLRGCDIQLSGGTYHDQPHVLYQRRLEDEKWKGAGKLASVGDSVVARLSKDAVTGLKHLAAHGLNHECRDVLNPFKIAPELFQKKPLNGGTFTLDVTLSDYLTCPNKEKE